MGQGTTWTEAQRAARLASLVERNRRNRQGKFLYENADWMRDAYVSRNLTLRQIATEAECGLRTVARWMQIHGIETRTGDRRPIRGEAHYNWRGGILPCPTCGSPRSNRDTRPRCHNCRVTAGDKNPNWRGDRIRNPQMHGRVKALRGQAADHPCAHCGKPAKDWAYDHADPNERPDPEGPFSLDPAHYMPLCRSCHKAFDLPYQNPPRGGDGRFLPRPR